MKRSELHRRTPLKRSPMKRRSRRRHRSRPTEEQLAARAYADCWLEQFSTRPCSGPIQLVHLIRKERMRFYNVDESLIWHPDVLVFGCEFHHHQLDATGSLAIPRDAIPQRTERFATRIGMGWWLDRYGERKETP